MEEWTILHDLAYKAVRELERKGSTAEAFFTATDITQIAIRNSQISSQNRLEDAGVGIRVALHNRIGFACTNTITEKAIRRAGEQAFSIAEVSPRIPDFVLPEPGTLPQVNGLYDPEMAEIKGEEAVDVAERAITAAEAVDDRVRVKSGLVLYESGCRGIINTQGIDCEEPETRASLYVGGIGEDSNKVTGICSDALYSRSEALNPEEIGESVGRKVCRMFNPQSVQEFEGTVIFGPEAVSYQLIEVLIDALKGDFVLAGRSFWTGKLEQKVASTILTVVDDGVLGNGFFSRQFDDEGCPSQQTVLIQNGILQHYLLHAASAHALHTENTGNASRYTVGFDIVANIIGNGYRTKPEPYSSNLVILPGTKSKEDLISEVKKGVLVESMAGFPQAGSGVISAQLSEAFFIENGEIQYPVKNGMISGAVFDWVGNISGMGNDVKQVRNAVVPSVRVEDVKVVG
jgi:PmbA protein